MAAKKLPAKKQAKKAPGKKTAAKKKVAKKKAVKKPAKKIAKPKTDAPAKTPASTKKTAAKKATKSTRHPESFKKEVVHQIVVGGEKANALAKKIGVSAITIGNWKKKYAGALVGGAKKTAGRIPGVGHADSAPKAAKPARGVSWQIESTLKEIAKTEDDISKLEGKLAKLKGEVQKLASKL